MPFTPLRPHDPSTAGPYRLTGRLGAGGMGVVYLAQALDGTPVALKLILPEFAHDPTFRARFAREVATARRVSGVCIARYLDADTDGDQPYLVTEYVDGPSLSEVVSARGPLAGPPLQALAAGLAEGLLSLHRAGVVHRDLKPSNVLLAADAPRIIDFGIAHSGDATSVTRTGHVVGSPGWMAPEQALGRAVTPAADVFSWASVMTYAATGRNPFGEGQPAAIIYRVVHEAPDTAGVPAALLPAVTAAFDKDPVARPDPAGLLGMVTAATGVQATGDDTRDVTRILDGAWVPVAPVAGSAAMAAQASLALTPPHGTPVVARPERPGSSRDLAVAAVAVVIALLVVGGAVWALNRNGSSSATSTTTTLPVAITTSTSTATTTTTSTSTTTSSTSSTTTTTAVPLDPGTAWSDLQAGFGAGTVSSTVFDDGDRAFAASAAGSELDLWAWDGDTWSQVHTAALDLPVGESALFDHQITGAGLTDLLVPLEDDVGMFVSIVDGRLVIHEFDVPYSGGTTTSVDGLWADGSTLAGLVDSTFVEWSYDPDLGRFPIASIDGVPIG